MFLAGAGGRGISPALGALGVRHQPGSATLLGGLALGRLAGQTGLGCFIADVALVPVLARTRGRSARWPAWPCSSPCWRSGPWATTRRPRRDAATYLARLALDRDSWAPATP